MASIPIAFGRSMSRGVGARSTRRRGVDGYDDEEAEVWAALERLPTYDRMRTTIAEGDASARQLQEEISIKDVDLDRYLADQIFRLNNPEEDNRRFLESLNKRIDDVGLQFPTVEIRYENMTVEGEAFQGGLAMPTLPNTVINTFLNLLTTVGLSPIKKTKLKILNDLSGVIKPGRLTLLLGPPGAGKTTFLLTLAGMLESDLKSRGTIEYNGYKLNEFEPRKTAKYVSQYDVHAPELTVRETMDYSARFQGVGQRTNLVYELLQREKERGIVPDHDLDIFLKAMASEQTSHDLVTPYFLKIMGLDICANTIVGNQMMRGISGGQMKRLTTGEMLVGPARALFMDEISTGLDSSTTYQIVQCIGQVVKIAQSLTVISLLQPAPEAYNLFDDLILLSNGYLIYHGPLEHVEEFFLTCGFKCPPRKAIPDFLQEVTSIKDQEQYWADKSKPYKFVPVLSFVEAFKNFHVAKKMQEELATPVEKLDRDSPLNALIYQKWSLPQWELFKINLNKEYLIFRKNSLVPIFNLAQLAVMSLLASSLFFRTRLHQRNLVDTSRYSAALFFILNEVVFLGYAEITFTAVRFPVFHKLREYYFFPPWTWALSLFLIKIPFSILESLCCIVFTYYIIGFAPQASRFFKLWLILALANLMGSGLFRMLAGFCRTFVIATSVGGFFLTLLFMLGGYVLPRNRIRKWWIWGYYSAPLSYVQNGVLVNEFLAPRWKKTISGDQHTLGHRMLLNADMFDRGYWYWLACGALAGFTVFFYLAFAGAITLLGVPGKSKAQVSKEQLDILHAQVTGEGVENTSQSKSVPRTQSSRSGEKAGSSSGESDHEGRGGASGQDPATAGGEDVTEAGPSSSRKSLEQAGPSDSSRTGSKNGTEDPDSKSAKPEPKGMILPFQPLAISFKNVNYYVDVPVDKKAEVGDQKLQLLQGVTGSFRPGVLTALIGVSGAGKSTLMDVLAGRKTKGYIEGDIRVSGYPKRQETFARVSGYCEQNDIHSSQVTVHESLIFSAWLRLGTEISDAQKMDFVQQVMDLVELTTLRDALVGVPGESGLSTEQRKRLTIAVELVANPSIIFMDEPTSGLDARAAATVMRAVRNTVDTGRTVVCTIHQPSIDIIDSFDELLLLKRGGKTIYHGPLGKHSSKLIEYLQAIEGVPQIEKGVNPAAWMLDVTTPGMEDKLGVDFAELFENSDVHRQIVDLVDELSNPAPGSQDLSFPSLFAQPMWRQLTCCLWKQNLAYWRTPDYNLMRVLLNLAVALLAGTLFYGMGRKLSNQQNVGSLMGAIYTSQIFIGVLTSTSIQPLIAAERTILYRERSAGMYSEFPYAIAQCLVEVPYVLAATSLFSIITFSMIKLKWKVKKFFWYLFFFFASQLTFAYWGMMTVALTPTPQTAAIIAGVFYNIWSLYSGFIITRPDYPPWWEWAYWTNPMSYHIYGVLVSQFGDLDQVYATTIQGGSVSVQQLLKSVYGFRHKFIGFIASMSIMFPFLFCFMFVLSIKYFQYQQR